MEKRTYQSLQELPLMLSMMDVASVLGISKAGAYTLAHSRDFLRSGLAEGSSFHRKNFWTGWKNRLPEVLSLRTSYFAVFVIFV